LIAPWPSVGHIYAGVAAGHGWLGLDPSVLNRRFGSAWKNLKDFNHTRAQWAALVEDTFDGLIPASVSGQFFPELYERFASPQVWRVFEDVQPTLKSLKEQGTRLGVVSNWDERLRPLLDRLDLLAWFEVIVVSNEVGAPKPSPRIFEHACQDFDLAPASVLHIGDSQEMDVLGASNAGLQAVLLDRAGLPGANRIRSLRELVKSD